MNDIIIARALHVLAVVIWIGGVAISAPIGSGPSRRSNGVSSGRRGQP